MPSSGPSPGRASHLGVAMLAALPLVLPWGYWAGPLWLAAAGLMGLARRRHRLAQLTVADRRLAALLLLLGLVQLLACAISPQGTRGLPLVLAAWLAVPALLQLRACPPSPAWWWGGMAAGGLMTGASALWQALVQGRFRPDGVDIDPILYGNLSLLTGLLCLAGLGWALHRHDRRWCWLMLAGALGGLMASGFAGARGGWVALPLVLWVFLRGWPRGQGHHLPRRAWWWLLVLLLLLPLALYLTPETRVKVRVDDAVAEFRDYVAHPHKPSSVTTRIALWQGAWQLIREAPMLGHGQAGFRDGMARLVARPDAPFGAHLLAFWHPHQDLLDAWVRRGLLGLGGLMALYLLPWCHFRGGRRPDACGNAAPALAGALVPVAYLGFGLSYGFFAYPAGLLVFLGWLLVPWVLVDSPLHETASLPRGSRPP
ncbi:O-antigen ligase family protein [Halomonas ventosae]|uniref:O-antigen ligase n=1 Tax=Halomonas ventosae TaxID=229007 RepID=A0A2T0VB43_9GAMM|nr:O-antigen ligase family protein [Halomonas ventosae]PRY67371.1 O-antigen ligase [Halomonas ventosae]